MRRAALWAVMLLTAVPAFAQTAAVSGPALSLSGRLAHPRGFSRAELGSLPKVSADLPGKPGEAPAHVSGVLVWSLLDQAGWQDLPGRKTHLQHTVLARGRDGYSVALSIGEIDPALEGKAVLVVTDRDGKPADRLDLFVPGDKRAARRIHDLVALDVQ
jgi:hypothetical protein